MCILDNEYIYIMFFYGNDCGGFFRKDWNPATLQVRALIEMNELINKEQEKK